MTRCSCKTRGIILKVIFFGVMPLFNIEFLLKLFICQCPLQMSVQTAYGALVITDIVNRVKALVY
jgi:hypothetical protein